MRRPLLLLALGVLTPMFQGALVSHLPRALVPDLSLLVVLALGLHWRSASGGLLVAGIAGFVADLLSGSLRGQHALLHIATFGAARYASVHVNLRGVGPQIVFAAALTAMHGVALGALTAFFSPGVGFGWIDARELPVRAAVNGVAAPLVAALVRAAVSKLGEGESGGRRTLRLEPRSLVS